MQLESLLYFVQIAGGKTYLEVAEENNMSQSALSKNIKKLENEIGLDLLVKSGRSVKLTQAGYQLMKDVQGIYPELLDITTHIKQFQKNNCVSVWIDMPGFSNIRKILKDFEKEHPEIDLTIGEKNYLHRTQHLEEMIPKENCDIEICHQSLNNDDPCVQGDVIYNDCIVMLMSSRHELAKKKYITYADLQHYQVYINGWGKYFYDHYFIPNGLSLNYLYNEKQTREEIIWNIIDSNKLGMFYASDFYMFNMREMVIRAISDFPLQFVSIRTKKKLSDNQQLLYDYIKNMAKKKYTFNIMEVIG